MSQVFIRKNIALQNAQSIKPMYEDQLDIFDKHYVVNEEQTRNQMDQIQQLAHETKFNNSMLRKTGMQNQTNRPKMMHRQLLQNRTDELKADDCDVIQAQKRKLIDQLKFLQEEHARVATEQDFSNQNQYISQLQTQLNQLKIQLNEQETLNQQYKLVCEQFQRQQDHERELLQQMQKQVLIKEDHKKQKQATKDIFYSFLKTNQEYTEVKSNVQAKLHQFRSSVLNKKASVKQHVLETTQQMQQSNNLTMTQPLRSETIQDCLVKQNYTDTIKQTLQQQNIKPEHFLSSYNTQKVIKLLSNSIQQNQQILAQQLEKEKELQIEIKEHKMPVHKMIEKQKFELEQLKSEHFVAKTKCDTINDRVKYIQSNLTSLFEKLQIVRPQGQSFLTMNMDVYNQLLNYDQGAVKNALQLELFKSIDCLVFAVMSKLQGLLVLDLDIQNNVGQKTPDLQEDEENQKTKVGFDTEDFATSTIQFAQRLNQQQDDLNIYGIRNDFYAGNLPGNLKIILPDDDLRQEQVEDYGAQQFDFPKKITTSFVMSRREMKEKSRALSRKYAEQQERALYLQMYGKK